MPIPFYALLQSDTRNRFDANEALDDRVFNARSNRRERKTAVSHHDRRNAMLRLAGAVGIPKHLRIQMGVMVDKTRRDGQARCVDGAGGAILQPTHFSNFAVFNADIGDKRRQTGTVDHAPAANNQIVSHNLGPPSKLLEPAGLVAVNSIMLRSRCRNDTK